ncbi:tRNA epoxyqueuosine(34) reductase QueG [Moorella naiadis]|uniref:tRNA epoxyqueuosine(34) reductase QueG n=1 Tax=Moorella naiadis (nom. illeg.) TaxID=3093670 RepID=UPI003D9CAA99
MGTGELQNWAMARGLVLGVAPVRTFEEGRAALEWRARQGFSTPFAAGRPEERYRPELLYPEARSLVVVARPHPAPILEPGPGQGVIACYALGPDYHEELGRDLGDLAKLLKQSGARLAVTQVDSGPLLEREAARLAGLGYYGASCNLIIPGLGTAFSLGLVITDLELEPGEPLATATCRNCGRCLAACPTGALLAPGRLNPELCLSYLTQKRGFIPPELRPALGGRIWGCDVCQEVCPENNRWAGAIPFRPRAGLLQKEQVQVTPYRQDLAAPPLTYPDLATILALDKVSFNRIFKGTALAWRGKTVLQRNAAIALGNMGDLAALATLRQALGAPVAILRAHAAWALGRLGPAGRPALAAALATEDDPQVRREIQVALDFKNPGKG